MKELTNQEKGALKRKLKIGKNTDFKPGELISKANAAKKKRVAVMGLV